MSLGQVDNDLVNAYITHTSKESSDYVPNIAFITCLASILPKKRLIFHGKAFAAIVNLEHFYFMSALRSPLNWLREPNSAFLNSHHSGQEPVISSPAPQ